MTSLADCGSTAPMYYIGTTAPNMPAQGTVWYNPPPVDQWLVWDGANWAPMAIGGGGGISLPAATQADQFLLAGPAPAFAPKWGSGDAGRY